MSEAPESGGWAVLAEYGSASAAEVDAAFLRSEGLAARVGDIGLPSGTCGFKLMVGTESIEKARWLLKFPPVSGAELDFLATGKLPDPDAAPSDSSRGGPP